MNRQSINESIPRRSVEFARYEQFKRGVREDSSDEALLHTTIRSDHVAQSHSRILTILPQAQGRLDHWARLSAFWEPYTDRRIVRALTRSRAQRGRVARRPAGAAHENGLRDCEFALTSSMRMSVCSLGGRYGANISQPVLRRGDYDPQLSETQIRQRALVMRCHMMQPLARRRH